MISSHDTAVQLSKKCDGENNNNDDDDDDDHYYIGGR